MGFVTKELLIVLAALLSSIFLEGGNSGSRPEAPARHQMINPEVFAGALEESLNNHILEPWYPRIIDTVFGGYQSGFNNDWSPASPPLNKSLVQQARHIWSTTYLYEFYPDREEYLDYAAHGVEFLNNHLRDKTHGGFYYECHPDGSGSDEITKRKTTYGQAFAVYGLAYNFRITKDPDVLEMARKAFLWMEDHPHDPVFGGYFDIMNEDGTPQKRDAGQMTSPEQSPATGLKDYNSSIHIMEAFTELYLAWPDSLVRSRLEEMFYLIRDTFVHPDGYLQLYFYPDWTLVPDETMELFSGGNESYMHHYTYGHDVETAFLLLETAHVLGWEEDETTHRVAKRLVDHSLESGWDHELGGFYDAGKQVDEEITIINHRKSWWSQVEGLNALVLMHTLYPDDPRDYYSKSVAQWEYIDDFLIDKEHGGWYNHGMDQSPDSHTRLKSHPWKTTYHNARGMVNCIRMLRAAR